MDTTKVSATEVTPTLEQILTESARRALDGTLNDGDRVGLFRLALTVAAEEFYRVEAQVPGSVNPATLLLLQQIYALTSDTVEPGMLLGATAAYDELIKNAPDAHAGSGILTP